jgi:hypothetical protein
MLSESFRIWRTSCDFGSTLQKLKGNITYRWQAEHKSTPPTNESKKYYLVGINKRNAK